MMIQRQQSEAYKPTLSKRRKKNQKEEDQFDNRSNTTKSRNRENAELDRYKRRLLLQYLKCLPYLMMKASQPGHQNTLAQDTSGLGNLGKTEDMYPIKQEIGGSADVREKAKNIAIQKFLQFHNKHIVEKNQKFSFESIKPETRRTLFTFIKNLISYTPEQLFQMDQKKLLDHSGPNSIRKPKQKPKQKPKTKPIKKQSHKKPPKKQENEVKSEYIPILVLPIAENVDTREKKIILYREDGDHGKNGENGEKQVGGNL